MSLGEKISKFSLYALLKLTRDSLTSKDFAFELNKHLGSLREREISDLNLRKILKLLSQYYSTKKLEHFLRVPMPRGSTEPNHFFICLVSCAVLHSLIPHSKTHLTENATKTWDRYNFAINLIANQ